MGRVTGSDRPPPISVHDFVTTEYVATGAVCGCVMIRTLAHVRHKCTSDENGMYECCVCARKGNNCEKEMLAKIKEVLQPRQEKIILCRQVPLAKGRASQAMHVPGKKAENKAPLRCDVLLVPCAARKASDMIAIELDGRDHGHDPFRTAGPKRRRVTKSLESALSATFKSDSKKRSAVEASGMRLLRVNKADLQGGPWIGQLNSMLDSLELGAM